MFTLQIPNKKRWRILENNKILLSGLGNESQALLVAKANGLILTGYDDSRRISTA